MIGTKAFTYIYSIHDEKEFTNISNRDSVPSSRIYRTRRNNQFDEKLKALQVQNLIFFFSFIFYFKPN